MKQLIMGIVIAMFSVCASAQKDVTRFLGIPVDGTKAEMIQKLKAKGFRPSTYNKEILEGEFNGRNVYLGVVTNGGKVWRVAMFDAVNSDEQAIKTRFNTLYYQFNNNSKYFTLSGYANTIPDDEDISYQMTVNNKPYEAAFFQSLDSTITKEIIRNEALKKYTQQELENPTKEIQTNLSAMEFDYRIVACTKKTVWFKIERSYGEYYIVMYYDNEYNKANGEDL
ncbi:MAG: hypothetical protein K2L49_06020 [Muribaculaceae bacterium]|nr:hypothetical protein [Muribaculaceae bacterium]